MKKTNNTMKRLLAAAVCIMLGCALFAAIPRTSAEGETTTVVVTSPFTSAIAQVRDSVVGVSNYQQVRYSNYGYGWYGFGFGYGNRGNDEAESREVLYGTGSGTVIAAHYVLTNYHVVENAARLTITVSHDDGTEADEYDAVLVTYDENLDIAILYSETLPLAPVTMGDSDSLEIGDWAIIIGNPLDETFSRTVTVGVVSGLNRSVASNNTVTDKYGKKTNATNSMIQTDAAINSGNSGGGMFSVTGELMGIPSLKYSGSTSSGASIDGIGMCIPINSCKELINEVLSGHITQNIQSGDAENSGSGAQDLTGKPRLGISVTTLTTNNPSLSYAVRYGLYYGILPNGVYVSKVEEGSPAEKAGIVAGDIIVEANGTVISATTELTGIISQANEGDTVTVKVYRVEGLDELGDTTKIPDGEYIDLDVTLAVIDAN